MTEEATADDVGRWMLEQVEEHGRLHQQVAVREIRDRFGEQFLRRSERSGYFVVHPDVLEAFRAVSGSRVVWSRGQRIWRERTDRDPSVGRQVP